MLEIIYGKSGTGKSSYLYNDIKKNLSNEKIYLIVPEQSNLKAEQDLINFLGVKSLFNVQVLTLSRIAYRILDQTGKLDQDVLTASGKAMIIYRILKENEKDLNFLGKSSKNVSIISNLITELKNSDVDETDLNSLEGLDKVTSLKIDDIKLILNKYEEKLKGMFIDENDILEVISKRIQDVDLFNNARVYIDDFSFFTTKEYMVIEEILKVADMVMVSSVQDRLDKGDLTDDIFYFNKDCIDKLINIAKRNSIEYKTLHLENDYKHKSDELKVLERNLSTNENIIYKEETKDVQLFLAKNPFLEMEHIACEILRLVKEENYKYNEISIITDNIDEYGLIAKVVLDKYCIPVFIDEKKNLNQNILIKYVLALIEVFSKNFSYESVFSYLKTGLLDLDEEDIFLLENYSKKWGIKYNKWFKEFNYEDINENQSKVEALRLKIITPLIELKNSFDSNKNVKDITKNLYDFLIKNDIFTALGEKIKEINLNDISSYNTSYKIFIDVLDTIVMLFGDEKISFENYKDLLEIGFSVSTLGEIPMSQDEIILGDSKRSRNNNIKICFVCGINDGYFPYKESFEGFLDDDDKNVLRENGIDIGKTSLENIYENNYEIYSALCMAEEKLYLSYASSSSDGRGIRPSTLIKRIKRMFINLKEDSNLINTSYILTNKDASFDDSIVLYKEFLDGRDISDEWKKAINYYRNEYRDKFNSILDGVNFSNTTEDISKENINKMYGSTLTTSISKLEQYRNCPFSFYLKYGLNISPNQEFKIESTDTGTFMHEIIDEFFYYIDENELNVKELSDEDVEKIVETIINDTLNMTKYYIFNSTAKFRMLTRRLVKVTTESIKYIVYTIRNSDFDLVGHEVEFKKGGKYKPIRVKLKSGKTLELTGKIDRIDVGKLDDETYVRIIDYKSSVKDLDLNLIDAGLQIQLITYLDAVCKEEDFDPSGVLYFNLTDNVCKSLKNESDEDIEKSIRKQFRMNGYVLADIEVDKMMDKSLNVNNTSDIIPVSITKDGDINKKISKVQDEDGFSNLEKNVENVIQDIGNEILHGKIGISPYKYKDKTGCDYCDYKSICLFNSNFKDNSYNVIG